ncbi:DUF1232 domain-containing protein [Poriferisphaera corsica]|nr:DUF1232 domain-containing protein [Poriferisphaera corsica]
MKRVNDEGKHEVVKVEPRKKRGLIARLIATIGVFLSVLFLLNFSFGVVEVPDNLPVIGNLDEVLACAILFSCLGVLGIRLPGQGR